MFDEDEYQSLIQVIAPTGTELFTAFFIINSSVTIGYLSFDIVDNMMVGESVSGSDFLINGTTPPVAISPPFESMYQLTISTGRVIDAVELMDNITFNLISYLNTTNGDTLISLANVTLYGKGNKSMHMFVYNMHVIYIMIMVKIYAGAYTGILKRASK